MDRYFLEYDKKPNKSNEMIYYNHDDILNLLSNELKINTMSL